MAFVTIIVMSDTLFFLANIWDAVQLRITIIEFHLHSGGTGLFCGSVSFIQRQSDTHVKTDGIDMQLPKKYLCESRYFRRCADNTYHETTNPTTSNKR